MDDAIASTAARLDELAAALERLQESLTAAGFAMADYAQPADSAAPRSDEVLSEQLRRAE